MLACDTLWDYETNSFQPNPFGETVPALYIGTEMKLYEEIEPIIWSVISGVEEDKIRSHNLTAKEKERVMEAIQIAKRSEIYLENEPDYTCAFIEYKVDEYKVNHNIGALIFDYIELIPPLTAEYVQMSKGVAAREDMVLLHLSTHLKNLANSYDIYVHAFTQIANEARRDEGIRDSGAIKGGKSLQARADLAVVTMRPTHKELTALKPIIETYNFPTPNLCYNIYKNRGGILVMVKVWSVVNLGNMKIENLFATNWNFQRIKIDKHNTIKKKKEEEVILVDEETGEVVEEKPSRRRTNIRNR